jgi:Na+/H+ antiporter NhaC
MLFIGIIQTVWPSKKLDNLSKEVNHKELDEEEHAFHRTGIKKELSLVKAQPWNLIIPVFLLLGLSLFLLWENGTSLGAKTLFEAFAMTDATLVMLLAVFITLILTFVFYIVRRQKLNEIMYHFYDGGNQMMQAISLLILIWALTLSAEDLGFSEFISSTLGSFLPGFMTPAIIFLIGSIVGYFIGSSWGTWGLFMPLGIALALSTDASIPLTVGAVFASGAFGAITSPLGDTTITTASILDMELVEYAKYKLKISTIGAIIATAIYIVVALIL